MFICLHAIIYHGICIYASIYIEAIHTDVCVSAHTDTHNQEHKKERTH